MAAAQASVSSLGAPEDSLIAQLEAERAKRAKEQAATEARILQQTNVRPPMKGGVLATLYQRFIGESGMEAQSTPHCFAMFRPLTPS